jgi:hypothetical protein
MSNIIDGIIVLAAITVNVVAILTLMQLSLRRRLGLATLLGGWLGIAVTLGAAGALSFASDQPVPLVGVLFATPLILAGASAALFPKWRAEMLDIPMPVLIGLHGWRILGVNFLILAAIGRLSGPFPYSAGLGDIATGV